MFTLEHVVRGFGPEGAATLPQGVQAVEFSEAVIDSRLVTPGCLFVALPGARADGHAFVAQALENGARAALVGREWARAHAEALPNVWLVAGEAPDASLSPDATRLLILVDAPLTALQQAARYKRSLVAPTVIGITGSVGKTSTKELTAAVLHHRFRTLKNPKSYNNEATLPLTLLQLNADHEVVVLEMGMWAPGEISLLCDLARPQYGIVTNVGTSHLERMGSIEAIAHAKGELPRALPSDGVAILNVDDLRVRAMARDTQARPFFYGLDAGADLWASEIESRGLYGIGFRAHYGGDSAYLKLPLLGRHSVHTALASCAVGLLLGMSWEEMLVGLNDSEAQLRLVAVPGIGGSQLIDDTYNASPSSMLAALNLLSELDGRRIVVLGDMLEQGSYEEEGHRLVGRRAAEVADLLIVCGQRARAWIGPEALAAGMTPETVQEAEDCTATAAILQPILQAGDVVLIKGSRGQAMERIVAALQRPLDHEEQTRGGA